MPSTASFHLAEFDKDCKVCSHEKLAMIEACYMRAGRIEDLSNLTALPKDDLRAHFDALGLTEKRSNNSDAFYARVIDLGLEHLNPEDITVEFLLKALMWKDKLNGRVIDKVESLRPTKIVIMAPPQTAQMVDAPVTEAAKVEKGEQVRALGPADMVKINES